MAIKKPPAPKVPAGYHAVRIPNPAADADYMREHANLHNQLNLFNQQQTRAAQQYGQNYAQQQQALGFNTAANAGRGAWNTLDLTPGTYGAAARDVSNDYTSRGMGYSTPFQTASANMLNDYTRREGAIATAKSQFTNTATDTKNQYVNTNNQADQTNLRSAVARIAAQYGIQPGQVQAGRTPVVNVRNS